MNQTSSRRSTEYGCTTPLRAFASAANEAHSRCSTSPALHRVRLPLCVTGAAARTRSLLDWRVEGHPRHLGTSRSDLRAVEGGEKETERLLAAARFIDLAPIFSGPICLALDTRHVRSRSLRLDSASSDTLAAAEYCYHEAVLLYTLCSCVLYLPSGCIAMSFGAHLLDIALSGQSRSASVQNALLLATPTT